MWPDPHVCDQWPVSATVMVAGNKNSDPEYSDEKMFVLASHGGTCTWPQRQQRYQTWNMKHINNVTIKALPLLLSGSWITDPIFHYSCVLFTLNLHHINLETWRPIKSRIDPCIEEKNDGFYSTYRIPSWIPPTKNWHEYILDLPVSTVE